MLSCNWDTAKFLIFSNNIDVPLIYYSHLTSILIFLVLFIVTFFKLKPWPKYSFRLLSVSYIVWLFCDLVLWANPNIENVLFFWSIINIIEPIIFIAGFSYVFSISSNDRISRGIKNLFLLILAPNLLLTIFNLSVVGFDYTNCDRNVVEGINAYYNYFIEALMFITTLVYGISSLLKEKVRENKRKILVTTIGMSLLMIFFLIANFLGTLFNEYNISQLGHIAVPLFASFLLYVTIRFDSFEPRVLLSDIMVSAVIILNASLLFVQNDSHELYIKIISLILSIFIGITLISGIRREVKQRKTLEVISKDLAEANEKLKGLDKLKTEFLSLATHQIRSPLTAIKGYTSMLLEGSFGKIDSEKKEPLERVLQTSNSLAIMVEDFLSVSKIESGGMKYMIEPFDFRKMVEDTYSDLRVTAEKKGLVMEFSSNATEPVMVSGDREKLRQVIINLTDNSIKYTPTGSISIHVEVDSNKTIFSVKDTGVGVSPETKTTLFGKFSRGEGAKLNTTGSGLGLYLAKEIIKAHHGKVWLESEGLGKGTTFFVELPIISKE